MNTADGTGGPDFMHARAGHLSAVGAIAPAQTTGSVGAEPAQLSPEAGDADYPALCFAPDGSAWAVWLTYAVGTDRIFAAHWTGQQWEAHGSIPGVQGDLYKPACGVDGAGRLWVVWPQQVSSDWDLWYTYAQHGQWAEPRRVVNRKGTDFAPRITSGPNGSLFLVWQAWSGTSFDILLSELRGEVWSDPEIVTANAANDWSPALAVAPDGSINVVWDSYRNGDFDVFLRRKQGGQWGPEIPIAITNRFEGYASIAADADSTLWIAYEERTEQWGKDRGHAISPNFDELDTLLGFSRTRVVCYQGGNLLQPVQPPKASTHPYDWCGDHLPWITVGRDGRVWLGYRRPTLDHPGWNGKPSSDQRAGVPGLRPAGSRSLIPLRAWWNNYAIYLDGDRWSEPHSFHDSASRVDSDFSGAALPDGRLFAVWHSDSRQPVGDSSMVLPTENRIYAGVLPAPGTPISVPALQAAETGMPPDAAEVGRERRSVEQVRSYRSGAFHVYRGDLHRHTNISWDGASDASITDLFRYALDAAALDFVAPTDHNQGPGPDVEYVWWRTQKIVDVFNLPPRFVSLFGYERGLGHPHGHRNIIEAQRGTRTFPRTGPDARHVAPDDTLQLFEHVRQSGGITIPHESGEVGTVWNDKDPAVEPVVEIYQGCRTSYEYEGAPRSDARLKPTFAYYPQGFVWNAWRQGFRLGVIASSDHQSTHIAYANVYAPELTREALLASLKSLS